MFFAAAYKHADGKKIDGRRVLVDVERARTVKGWLPRRLGGGLGGTRRGGPDVNIKHSGREDNERERERYRLEREREERGGRERERDRGAPERRRSRSRERRRRSRSRSRDRKRRRSRERIRTDEVEEVEVRPPREKDRERERDRDRDRKRRRSKSRERDRERKREKKEKRERDRGERLEYIKTDDGGEIRIKEEPLDDYPDYSKYHTQPFNVAHVKYEDDEEEKKFEPDNSHNGSNQYDDEFEEGEAY